MLNKIAFLCANPWERFLPLAFQGSVREYYRWACTQAVRHEIKLFCQERIELYGEVMNPGEEALFERCEDTMQFLYVQSSHQLLLREVFRAADLVVIGMPGCKKECDKIFLSVLPWKEKMLFLWDSRICAGKSFLRQIQREYQLEEAQMLEIKQLPPR